MLRARESRWDDGAERCVLFHAACWVPVSGIAGALFSSSPGDQYLQHSRKEVCETSHSLLSQPFILSGATTAEVTFQRG